MHVRCCSALCPTLLPVWNAFANARAPRLFTRLYYPVRLVFRSVGNYRNVCRQYLSSFVALSVLNRPPGKRGRGDFRFPAPVYTFIDTNEIRSTRSCTGVRKIRSAASFYASSFHRSPLILVRGVRSGHLFDRTDGNPAACADQWSCTS